MTALSQLAGKRFGNLLVLSQAPSHVTPSGNNRTRWHCQCDCGQQMTAWAEHLVSGRVVSCGCRKIERVKALNTKHGLTGSLEWNSWRGMKERCHNPRHVAYDRYGGRGVKVCDRWRDSFENFVADMGPRPPRTSLDRIDSNGDYEPRNCRWATNREQRINQRASDREKLTPELVIEARLRVAAGERVKDLATEFGVNRATLGDAVTGRHWADLPNATGTLKRGGGVEGGEQHARATNTR